MKPLPLFAVHDGSSKRSALTCKYKCGDACFHEIPNTSTGEYFGDIVKTAMSRRGVIKGGAMAVLAVGAGSALAACSTDEPASTGASGTSGTDAPTVDGVDFVAVEPNTEDAVVIPEGYEQAIVIRWGDAVVDGAPEFDFDNQTAAAQAKQFGFNNDFAGLLAIDGTPNAHLLVVNHEYTTEPAMFKGYDAENPTREQFDVALAAHGLSVVQVQGESGTGKLTPAMGEYNRRITGTTEFVVTGPAAGSDLLKTSVDPTGTKVFGTFNNCSGGLTP